MRPLASSSPGEWAGFITPALAILGAVIRYGRKLVDQVAANTAQNTQLLADHAELRKTVLAQQMRLDSLNGLMQKVDTRGSEPVKRIEAKLDQIADQDKG